MKEFNKTRWFIFCTYILLILATFLVGFVLTQNNKTLNNVIVSFFEVAENRTFDYRQSIKIIQKQPKVNRDIVVLAIDDASLEMLWEKYGEWPIPRDVYADVVNYLEKYQPKAIIFDLLFIKSIRSTNNADKKFTDTMNKYDNIYTSISFDNQPYDVRKPQDLPSQIAIDVENNSGADFSKKYKFLNCRTILPELMSGKIKVGEVNIIRNNDGIIRKVAPFIQYKDNYYPHLSFLAGANILTDSDNRSFVIDKNQNVKIGEYSNPITKEGDLILNWYGVSGTHTVYPFYKVINSVESGIENFDFKDKIIFIGTTAMSLHDTKSVPVQEGVYPGVEVHATLLNNVLDNNFVKQTSNTVNMFIIGLLMFVVGFIVMASESNIFTVLSTTLFAIAYLLISYYILVYNNIWIPVVFPVISIILAFILSLLAKYIIKSRDFEYQYKLATIDGLTELYNHRYFQETLKNQIETAKRYNQSFSLMIIDIDFFKKFNDTYGHQAGDAVLRQVAQTLKKNSRITDYVCRYGGEEMSIILPNTSKNEAVNSANRILEAIRAKDFKLSSNTTGKVTVSIGVSTFPEDAETNQDLIEYADKCLYYAKEHGRNQLGQINK